MKTENELKACPCCNGKAQWIQTKWTKFFCTYMRAWSIRCVDCKLSTPEFIDDGSRDIWPEGQARHECKLVWHTRNCGQPAPSPDRQAALGE